jgi:hypothetical protein
MDVPLGREISVLQTPDARAIYRDNWDSSIDLLNTEELGAKADVHPDLVGVLLFRLTDPTNPV